MRLHLGGMGRWQVIRPSLDGFFSVGYGIPQEGGRQMKQEKSCGALVCRQRGKNTELLLLRHRNGGHWSFP